jgi:hypothetical protein
VHTFRGVHLSQQSIEVSAAVAQMQVRVNPAERRAKQYPPECSDGHAVIDLAVVFQRARGNRLGFTALKMPLVITATGIEISHDMAMA